MLFFFAFWLTIHKRYEYMSCFLGCSFPRDFLNFLIQVLMDTEKRGALVLNNCAKTHVLYRLKIQDIQ